MQRVLGETALFPWGTLAVTVTGSFLIGIRVSWLSGSPSFHSIARPFLIVGCLGGFTLFSAFSIETLGPLQDGRWAAAGAYAVASVTVCVIAAWAGLQAG